VRIIGTSTGDIVSELLASGKAPLHSLRTGVSSTPNTRVGRSLPAGSIGGRKGGPAAPTRKDVSLMSVTVRVPPVFRTMTAGASQLRVDGGTVGEVLANLDGDHPGFKDKLLDDQGTLVRYVNLFVDDDDVRFLQGLDTPIPDGGTLSIMQAVAGG
jgi:molybdopterin converting factor small subunit